jgi:tRNA-dihydrouridine synthase A
MQENSQKSVPTLDRRLCVAPMMDWTDRHCRYLHRRYAPHALLYSEMIVAKAVLRGDAERLLAHDAAEHPVALQLGGCDPAELAGAARIGAAAGYAEINLNVGCPSDRVKNGSFGACLMLKPSLVADCVRSMKDAVAVPVTVKCRIGIDDRDDYGFFAEFADAMVGAGVDALIVHARAAILGGLSPKENREIPPLKYDYVHRLRRDHPHLAVVLNGGLTDAAAIMELLASGGGTSGPPLGVMLGRAAYHRPALLGELERALIDPAWSVPEPSQVLECMVEYGLRHSGRVRLHAITRHMHGLMAGREGARAWRRFLSEVVTRPEVGADSLFAALPILEWGIAA